MAVKELKFNTSGEQAPGGDVGAGIGQQLTCVPGALGDHGEHVNDIHFVHLKVLEVLSADEGQLALVLAGPELVVLLVPPQGFHVQE